MICGDTAHPCDSLSLNPNCGYVTMSMGDWFNGKEL